MGKFIAGIYFSDCITCGRPRALNPNRPCGSCVALTAQARPAAVRRLHWREWVMWGVTILALIGALVGAAAVYGPKIEYTPHWFTEPKKV